MGTPVKLCVSNIAWPNEAEPEVAGLMVDLGLRHVEVAPTKIWTSPPTASDAELDAYRLSWNEHGIEICALQALLYGRGDLMLFGSPQTRVELLAYLRGMCRVGARLGAGPLVFGAPKNRARGDLGMDEAHAIALEFFAAAGQAAYEEGTTLCLEANPSQYGCDWITTSLEAERLVSEVDTPGFGLHLDAAGMVLAEEDGADVIERCAGAIRHFHISEPYLGALGEGITDHRALARALQGIQYPGVASVEMRHDPQRDTIAEVRRALTFLLRVYGPADECP